MEKPTKMAPHRRLLSASLLSKLPWTNADKMEGESGVDDMFNKRQELLNNFHKRKRNFRKDTFKTNESRLDIDQVTKCVFLGSLCLKPVPDIFNTPRLLDEFLNKLRSGEPNPNNEDNDNKPIKPSSPTHTNDNNNAKNRKLKPFHKDEVTIKEEIFSYDYDCTKIAEVNLPRIKTDDGSSPEPIRDDPIDDSSDDSFITDQLSQKVYINEVTGLSISEENIKKNHLELLMPYDTAPELGQSSLYPEGVALKKYEDLGHYSDEDLENDIMYISVDKETYDFYENVQFGDENEDAFDDLPHNEDVKSEFKDKVNLAVQKLAPKKAPDPNRVKKIYRPQCKICSTKFSNYRQLKKHRTEHDGENPYICPKCGENHNTLEMLLAHLRTHQGKRPHFCKKCMKGFKTLEALEAHQPVHVLKKVVEPKRMFKCEECGKEFRKLCDLERHTRVHTGEKPCVCNICNRGFQQAHNLNKHLLIHTQEKPHQCDICQKRFGRNDVLNRHLLTHAVTKPNTCEYCSKSFIRATQLLAHIEKHHAKGSQMIPQLL